MAAPTSSSTPFAETEFAPLIMTALFDAQSFALLDGLRSRYFPPALNRVPAHATLFHHLPGAALRAVVERMRGDCAATAPFPFTMTEARFLGRGVALAIACPGLVALRQGFAAAWKADLTAQDRQGYRPHATIQNKVSAEEARGTLVRLEGNLPIIGRIEGLALWHYRGGPWEEAGRFMFGG
ncbi:MAG: 2'-5' RNA ligase family protein [Janthinobacterium lividum]